MTRPNLLLLGFVDSGITAQTPDSDVKYLRFLNATLLLFTLAQLSVLALLTLVELWDQLFINLAALGLCWAGFLLNRQGRHLAAKVLVLTVLTANTAYFAVILGSSAPAHLWLVPMAVLGIHVSDDFRAGLEDTIGFEERGEITLKGVGPTRTHWLVSRQRQGS